MAGSYKEARRLQAEGSLFENQGDAEEAIADTLEIVDEMLGALKWVARDVIQPVVLKGTRGVKATPKHGAGVAL